MKALLRRILNWINPKQIIPKSKVKLEDIVIAYDDVDLHVFLKSKG